MTQEKLRIGLFGYGCVGQDFMMSSTAVKDLRPI